MRRGKPDRRWAKARLHLPAILLQNSPRAATSSVGTPSGAHSRDPLALPTLQDSERRARLRLFLSPSGRFGLARQRNDSQRSDAIALAAQHAEAQAVEAKTLAAFGDRARLVNHQAGNRGRLFVRQMPVHGAVEIAD